MCVYQQDTSKIGPLHTPSCHIQTQLKNSSSYCINLPPCLSTHPHMQTHTRTLKITLYDIICVSCLFAVCEVNVIHKGVRLDAKVSSWIWWHDKEQRRLIRTIQAFICCSALWYPCTSIIVRTAVVTMHSPASYSYLKPKTKTKFLFKKHTYLELWLPVKNAFTDLKQHSRHHYSVVLICCASIWSSF